MDYYQINPKLPSFLSIAFPMKEKETFSFIKIKSENVFSQKKKTEKENTVKWQQRYQINCLWENFGYVHDLGLLGNENVPHRFCGVSYFMSYLKTVDVSVEKMKAV